MSTILRTLRNLRRIGLKEYGHQMQYMGDTKAGKYIATDRYGNKYYENLEEELPCMWILLEGRESEEETHLEAAGARIVEQLHYGQPDGQLRDERGDWDDVENGY
jgi:hypothetical protein